MKHGLDRGEFAHIGRSTLFARVVAGRLTTLKWEEGEEKEVPVHLTTPPSRHTHARVGAQPAVSSWTLQLTCGFRQDTQGTRAHFRCEAVGGSFTRRQI